MKILYYSPHPYLNLSSKSGYGTHMREMVKAFRALGHEVETLIMGGEEANEEIKVSAKKDWKQSVKLFIPAILWTTTKDWQLQKYDRFAQNQLIKKAKKFQPDFIYERSAYLQSSGVNAAKMLNIPHFMEINSPHVEEIEVFQGKSFYRQKGINIEKTQMIKSDVLLPVSSALRDYLSDKYGIEKEKFLITPNAIDPDKLVIKQSGVEKIKEIYQLKDFLVVGFVGSIFPWHGLDKLIDAVHQLGSPKIKIMIVGDGEILPKLKEQASNLDLSDTTIFTGRVSHEEVFNHIECMDITVGADSHWYGSPVKIFEYGGIGKAVIAPDNIPVKDVMIDGKDGILVKPTVESLKNAIEFMLNNPAKREEMAQSFHQKVVQNHKWTDNAATVISGFQNLTIK